MIPIGDDVPAQRRPMITVAIILACVLIFLWQTTLGPTASRRVAYGLGMVPAVLLGSAELPPSIALVPAPLTLVTSMFLHGGWAHLLGNLLYLWVFGNNIEDRLGHLGFILFYLVCGLAAAAAQIVPEPGSTVPMIGASGAISGVLGAYLVLHPRANVIVFIPFSLMFIHRIQAVWMLGIWLVLQLVSALATPPGEGGVAWWAHIGGFLAGMAIAACLPRRPVRHRRGPWG